MFMRSFRIHEKMLEIQGKIDKSKIIVGNFNTLLSII